MLKVTQNTAQVINFVWGYLESQKYKKFLESLKLEVILKTREGYFFCFTLKG